MAVATVEQDARDWEVAEQQVGLWQDAWVRFRRNRLAVAGLALVSFLIIVAVVSPLLVKAGILIDPFTQRVEDIEVGPGVRGHIMGTDLLGRDTLSRLMIGSEVSLTVG